MLTSLRIQNFKAWKDTGPVRLAPLTVIFGANSAGKSSLGHLLLALKQTALSVDRRRALHLGDPNTLIDLGTFTDCLHGHDTSQSLRFKLAWRLPSALEVKDPLQPGTRFKGDELSLDATLAADKNSQPEVASIRYALSAGKDKLLAVEFQKEADGKYALSSDQYRFVRAQGRKWPLEEPEKFYRISELSRARFQNAGFLNDFALATETLLSRFYYLGPLRDYPRRTYQWAGDTPEDVGQKGEYAIPAILSAQAQQRMLNRGPKKRQQPFAEFIAAWLKDLGIIDSFIVKPVAEGRKEFEVLVRTHSSASEVKITDVGFGVSQVLPALVEAFYCPFNSVVWMEQPEIHLHPQVQSELADVLISAIQAREGGDNRGVQLIVESHSEHLLNRLQLRIAEGQVSPDDVAIYFCKRGSSGTELEPLRVNLYGEIENWPENFFGDEMAELTARTVAAMKRREAESEAGA
jgi:predicted ATPase